MKKASAKVFDRIWKDGLVWGRLNGEHAFVGLSACDGIYCQYNLAVTPILKGCSVEALIDKGFVPNKDQDAPVPNWSRCAQDPNGNWQLTIHFDDRFSRWQRVRRYPTFCGALLACNVEFLAWQCVEVEISYVGAKP